MRGFVFEDLDGLEQDSLWRDTIDSSKWNKFRWFFQIVLPIPVTRGITNIHFSKFEVLILEQQNFHLAYFHFQEMDLPEWEIWAGETFCSIWRDNHGFKFDHATGNLALWSKGEMQIQFVAKICVVSRILPLDQKNLSLFFQLFGMHHATRSMRTTQHSTLIFHP